MLDLLKVDLLDRDERNEVQAAMKHFATLSSRDNDLMAFGPLMLHMQCADPRDKVYSLLGLLKDTYSSSIPIDYEMDVAEVFAQATFAAIDVSQNLDMLCLVSQPCAAGISGLPSWVVDFTFPRCDKSGRFRADNVHGLDLKLCRPVPPWHTSQPSTIEKPHLDSASSSLRIRALRFGSLRFAVRLSSRMRYYPDWNELNTCDSIRTRLEAATLDPVYPLRRCDKQTTAAILGLIGRLPLRDGMIPYECGANLLRAAGSGSREFVENLQLDRWAKYMEAVSGGRSLFVTDHGLLGVGPATLDPGAVVVLPYHSRYPLLLREDANTLGRYEFLSLAHTPGIKDLKLHSHDVDDGRLVAEDFVIT